MTFTPIINSSGKRWQPVPRVRFYASGKNYRQAVISLTRPVLDSMSWNPGDRILVSAGSGDDFGKSRLMRVKSGGQKLSKSSSANFYTISFVVPDEVGHMSRAEFSVWASQSKDPCAFEAHGDSLIITLPATALDAAAGSAARIVDLKRF